MKVIAFNKYPERNKMDGVEFVSVEKLFSESDALTLHAPLNKQSQGIICTKNIALMKSSAFIINTGRGGLIVESDLKEALDNNTIAGAGLDVLTQEPPPIDHVLLRVRNCIITPHQAWASKAARQRLMDELVKNVDGFLKGDLRNLIK